MVLGGLFFALWYFECFKKSNIVTTQNEGGAAPDAAGIEAENKKMMSVEGGPRGRQSSIGSITSIASIVRV